jgi:two-component system, sensor histidine kinase and response regulator
MTALAGRSLLVADRDAAGLGHWRERLLGQGARVICSSSMDSALANAITFPPGMFDAAVIEHRPPQLDAVELAGSLRALPSMRKLPVIVIVAVDGDAAAFAANGSPLSVVMTRPVSAEQLVDQLSRMLTQPAAPALRRGGTGARSTPYRGAVLVAEDDAVNAEVLRTMLSALGLQVVQVADGARAVALSGVQRFDLLLMDGQMPVLDGLAATRLIRARESEAGDGVRQTIIGATANDSAEYRAQCLAAGMDDVVAKPVSTPALVDLLARWLPAPVSQVPVALTAVTPATVPHSALSGQCEPVPACGPVDWSQVEPLRSVSSYGANGLIGKAIGLYIDHAPRLIEEILTYRVTGDLKDVRRAAHSLKSSSASLGVNAVADLSKTIELAAAKGDFEIIDSVVTRLQSEYRRAESELRKAAG